MNDLIFQLHTPEELRYLSSLGHWLAGGIFLIVSVVAFLQVKGLIKSKWFIWQALVVVGGLFFIPFTLLHHRSEEFSLVWRVMMLDPQQRQHLIMFSLITLGGAIELMIAVKKPQTRGWSVIFPTVLFLIGLLFLFHPQHGTSEALEYSVPYHIALGTALLLTGVTKAILALWSPKFKPLGNLWILFLLIASVMLLSYREPAGTYEMSMPQPVSSELEPPPITDSPGFIEELRARNYQPTEITRERKLSETASYTSYTFSYASDGLKIYGRMNVPAGAGPFPVIILNHGYFNQSSFTSGDGTQAMAEILATKGYLTLASDYRGFGLSENDGQASRGHNPNYAIDVLNLVSSVKNLESADSARIGLWGHSMGGEVALRTVEATDAIKATVLWAPTSGRVSDNTSFYGRGRSLSPASADADGASPINYIRFISSPISLHQGLADTEVNPEWSKELNDVLKKEGKSIEYFEYPGQDHNFRNLGWGIISTRTVEFFDKYLK